MAEHSIEMDTVITVRTQTMNSSYIKVPSPTIMSPSTILI